MFSVDSSNNVPSEVSEFLIRASSGEATISTKTSLPPILLGSPSASGFIS